MIKIIDKSDFIIKTAQEFIDSGYYKNIDVLFEELANEKISAIDEKYGFYMIPINLLEKKEYKFNKKNYFLLSPKDLNLIMNIFQH
jgi:hypothetical protein